MDKKMDKDKASQIKMIIFDIDGTLTINDFEAAADYLGIKTASTYADATDPGYAGFVQENCSAIFTVCRSKGSEFMHSRFNPRSSPS